MVPYKIVKIPLTARGQRVGETHPNAHHSDADVAFARQLRSEGVAIKEIARRLGAKDGAVGHWVRGFRRNLKGDKIMIKRVPV